jgi:hypothetical protein
LLLISSAVLEEPNEDDDVDAMLKLLVVSLCNAEDMRLVARPENGGEMRAGIAP